MAERLATSKAPDHGGNLDAAARMYGGAVEDWIDLSTGINRVPYPVAAIPNDAWCALPRQSDVARLTSAASEAYGMAAQIVPVAGAQAAIQAVPGLRPVGHARILAPTYNEHAACLRHHGWTVQEVDDPDAVKGADLAVVVSPNNPDGRVCSLQTVADLAQGCGVLVVDESFADAQPDLAVTPYLAQLPDNVVVLRSFGKFYGLAGLRLGFAISRGPLAEAIQSQVGPWPVSGPAIEIGALGLLDRAWQAKTRTRLRDDAQRMDALAQVAGWTLAGGTPLFRTYVTPNAAEVQKTLAQERIWTRIFPYSKSWVRIGLPAPAEWTRIESAFASLGIP